MLGSASLSLGRTKTATPAAKSDIVSFTIELDSSDGASFFEPSQGLQGRTVLVLSQSICIDKISVCVHGVVSGGMLYSVVGPQASTTRHLFEDTIVLFPSSAQPSQTLAAGKHTWPFSFRVPPVSILPPTYRGKMGGVKYEAVTTLEINARRKLVAKNEIPVRSVETRHARRALETPVFKTVQIAQKKILNKGGAKIDLAVKMPRAAFTFDEQIPFTVSVLNPTSTPLLVTDIAIEERVTVIYADRSKWGPITTTRTPFPFTQHIPPSNHNESRSFRLALPALEPQTPHPNIPDPTAPFTTLRRISRRNTLSDSTRGLNASFQTQPLKLTHHIVFKIRGSGSNKARLFKPIVIDIPIVLIPTRREASLLYQNEGLVALVEEVEREEEERERRREGRARTSSIDTLPVYEGGHVESIVLERGEVLESISQDGVDGAEATEGVSDGPPEYDAFGFDESVSLSSQSVVVRVAQDDDDAESLSSDYWSVEDDEFRESCGAGPTTSPTDTTSASSATSATTSTTAAGAQLVLTSSQSFRSTITQSYQPPGEDVILLTPFIDNNPPSFRETFMDAGQLLTPEERRGALFRRSSLTLRSRSAGEETRSGIAMRRGVTRAVSSSALQSQEVSIQRGTVRGGIARYFGGRSVEVQFGGGQEIPLPPLDSVNPPRPGGVVARVPLLPVVPVLVEGEGQINTPTTTPRFRFLRSSRSGSLSSLFYGAASDGGETVDRISVRTEQQESERASPLPMEALTGVCAQGGDVGARRNKWGFGMGIHLTRKLRGMFGGVGSRSGGLGSDANISFSSPIYA
ncbi:hypothetical protein HDU98_004927 [Podochytrium sp. JEL0797]|nr:hypothetical protein HDU98_004927 [Podochytrium sp. JEL0797]